MTDTNWPNPERPGVPMFPERDGWHIVMLDEDRHEYWWDTEYSYWTTVPDGDLIWTIEEAAFEFTYIGPVLTPTQIAEMLAGERERIKAMVRRACNLGDIITPRQRDMIIAGIDSEVVIRNLGAAS